MNVFIPTRVDYLCGEDFLAAFDDRDEAHDFARKHGAEYVVEIRDDGGYWTLAEKRRARRRKPPANVL